MNSNNPNAASKTVHGDGSTDQEENVNSRSLPGNENGTLPAPDTGALPPVKNTRSHMPEAHKNERPVQHHRKKAKSKAEPKDSDARMRERLATGTIVLLFALLIAYMYTRDPILLGLETVFGVAIAIVFQYYFSQRSRGR